MNDLAVASILKSLKPGDTREVKTEAERIKFLRVAKMLRNFDSLKVGITTRRNKDPKTGKDLGGFTVIAL